MSIKKRRKQKTKKIFEELDEKRRRVTRSAVREIVAKNKKKFVDYFVTSPKFTLSVEGIRNISTLEFQPLAT